MTSLLILGAGGHGAVIADTVKSLSVYDTVSFLDDSYLSDPALTVLGIPVIGPLALSLDKSTCKEYTSAIVAIGDAGLRLYWLSKLQSVGYELPPIIHPSAYVSTSAILASGSVVLAMAAVQSRAVIGLGAIINTSSSVDHDSILCDGVHVCPGSHLAGGVHVGSRSCIGIGSSVIQQVSIGSDVTIGAGAAVIDDIPDSSTAVGIPARLLSQSNVV